MTPAVHDFPVDELSVDDRLTLIGRLWDSLWVGPESPPLPAWHREVIAQRLADDLANPDDIISYEEMRAELLGDEA